MKKKHTNLSAYDNFERLKTFEGDIELYRKAKIESAAGHVSFIKKLFPKKRIRMVELGSGNSKTLYALEKAGMLEKGYGLEVSKSRYKFAELWKKEWNFRRAENKNADVLKTDFKNFGSFDLCFCVDLAFQFFEPIEKGSAVRILRDVFQNLNPGGKIVLELDGCERIISRLRNNSIKLWEEFQRPDPWRYSLWDCTFDQKSGFITWKKTYIKRDNSGISENTAVLKIYKRKAIEKLLKKAGFEKIAFYADWMGKKFVNDQGEYIVVGEKASMTKT